MSAALDCRDEQRRSDVLEHPVLNGIDHVEVDPADHALLRVHFLKPLPAGAYGLPADLTRIVVTGGARVVGLRPVAAQRRAPSSGDPFLEITLDRGGDFSPYTLELVAGELDPVLRRIPLGFMAACPVDLDCPTEPPCPPPADPDLLLDYLARDYASFRRLLLDLLPQLNPGWTERSPADLGIALVELLAHEGDHLAYFQDAVANEAYLDTARRRISARRHARLVDYRMHDGRNAWTAVQLAVGAAGVLPRGTRVLTRVTRPLAGAPTAPGAMLSPEAVDANALERDPALAGCVVFETAHDQALRPEHNELAIHTFGDEGCVLPAGATEAHLFAVPAGTTIAVRPALAAGDLLVLEEVRGPRTGAPADADPARRALVRIEGDPEDTADPVYSDAVVDGRLSRWQPGDDPLPLQRVRWRREDALADGLCLSSSSPELGVLRGLSVARGNVVLADHGITAEDVIEPAAPVPADEPFRLPLPRGPLTLQAEPEDLPRDALTGLPVADRGALDGDARAARPAVALLVDFATGDRELWRPVPDLLESPPFAQDFVAEVDDDGRAVLRFGDGEHGREPAGAVAFRAVHRMGNGTAGNVGAEALAHVAAPAPAPPVLAVRNPLAATGGTDPETVEDVRRLAPEAFRATQLRAVTEADWAEAAVRLPGVAGAVATFRWTGTWHTVFVGIDPADPADLVNLPDGRTQLTPAFARAVLAGLERVRIAGYDLEVRAPRFVPLELDVDVCAAAGHFRSDVRVAVEAALMALFDPGSLTFAQPVFLSRIYAVVEGVEGVESSVVTRLRRFGKPDAGELDAGVLTTGAWEVARLDNDPSFLEHGLLRVTVKGGKA